MGKISTSSKGWKGKKSVKKKVSEVEKKFNKYVEEHTARIQMHIENAIKELQKAENISEETCVPFDSRVIYKFCTDKYIPDSVDELKKMFPEEIVENFLEDDFYGHPDGRSTGWESEGWSSSSLTC